jgi:hypothetical protein
MPKTIPLSPTKTEEIEKEKKREGEMNKAKRDPNKTV